MGTNFLLVTSHNIVILIQKKRSLHFSLDKLERDQHAQMYDTPSLCMIDHKRHMLSLEEQKLPRCGHRHPEICVIYLYPFARQSGKSLKSDVHSGTEEN